MTVGSVFAKCDSTLIRPILTGTSGFVAILVDHASAFRMYGSLSARSSEYSANRRALHRLRGDIR